MDACITTAFLREGAVPTLPSSLSPPPHLVSERLHVGLEHPVVHRGLVVLAPDLTQARGQAAVLHLKLGHLHAGKEGGGGGEKERDAEASLEDDGGEHLRAQGIYDTEIAPPSLLHQLTPSRHFPHLHLHVTEMRLLATP